MRRLLRMRSFITIAVFAAAALTALRWPLAGMALICLCLIGYLRPDIPAVNNVGRAAANTADVNRLESPKPTQPVNDTAPLNDAPPDERSQ